jgi:RNA polymerase sigma-70 factor, ECF subfamily
MTRAEDPITRQVQRLYEGDPIALQELLTAHLPWIEARVRMRLSPMVRRDGDTQDFVQETMLEVLRDGPRFTIDSPEQFRALLARIVENTLIDRHRYMLRDQRDHRRQRDLPTDSVLMQNGGMPSVTAPPDRAARSEQQAWLRLALELLDPEDRESIRLRDWDELSFVSAGARLGITEEAARKRYHRALPKLAQKLELLRRGRWQDQLDVQTPPDHGSHLA